MHVDMTCQMSKRFHAPVPFATVVTYACERSPLRSDVTNPKGGIAMLKHQSRLLLAALALAVPAASASTVAAAAGVRPQAGPWPTPVLRAIHLPPAGVKGRPVGSVPLRVPNP